MNHLILFSLMGVSVLISAIARRRGWAAPLIVVIVMSAISFLPGLPDFAIDSELILTLVLPPLLYSAALNVSVISFRKNLRDITMLGVVLVAVTAVAVAAVAYWIVPDMSWAAALVLGALVAPPDAVSATSIGRKLGLPRRLMTVMLGESLINDATSLTLFKVGLTLVAGASLTFSEASGIFSLAVAVGIGLGVAIGLLFSWARTRLHDPVVEAIFSVLVPFFAYSGAEELGGSGVLAVVAAGLLIGYRSPVAGYRTRLQEEPVWRAADLLLESLVFALIGLQLKDVIEAVASGDRGFWFSLAAAGAVLAVTILVRPVFIFALDAVGRVRARIRLTAEERREEHDASSPTLLTRSIRVITPQGSASRRFAMRAKERVRALGSREDPLSWRELLVLSWTGMRGVVTLAAAFSVPQMISGNRMFPAHDMLMFIAFVVTIGTLLLQGLTLPWLIRVLNVSDPGQEERDRLAKRRLLQSTLQEATDFVKRREGSWRKKYGDTAVNRAVTTIEARLARIERQLEAGDHGDATPKERAIDRRHVLDLRRQVLQARREILLRERNAGHIDEEVMREVLHGLDAEELALDRSVLGGWRVDHD